eukprot:5972336-Pleurochrysis_carterae.AAC.1
MARRKLTGAAGWGTAGLRCAILLAVSGRTRFTLQAGWPACVAIPASCTKLRRSSSGSETAAKMRMSADTRAIGSAGRKSEDGGQSAHARNNGCVRDVQDVSGALV